jgi:hypothetical protein
MSACNSTNNHAQYTDLAQCTALCAKLPLGTDDGATSGNTVGCRQYHAGVAATTPDPHCHHAGPTGGNACGAYCENYCNLSLTTCTGTSNAAFADLATCNATCSSYNFTNVLTFPTDTDKNTFACRAYHLTVATGNTAAANTHCVHTGLSGGNACGSLCDSYCYFAQLACTAGNQLYASLSACMTNCSAFSGAQLTGASGATDGDSLQCRIYHLAVASTSTANAGTHCPHGMTTSATCAGSATTATTSTSTTATTSTSATTSASTTGDSTRFGFLFVLSFLGMLLI